MDDPNQLDLFPRPAASAETSGKTVKTHSTSKMRRWRLLGRFPKIFRVKNAMPCVGLVVLAGCLTFIVAPDEETTAESRLAAALEGSLPTVVIDPGHGGKDEGARSHGLREKELSLALSLRLETLLKTVGFPTVLTRRDDTYVSLAERAAVANKIENAVFISIHFNHSRNSAATGVETFYATEKVAPEAAWSWVGFFTKPEDGPTDNGEDLAGYIQTALVSRTDAENRGIKQRPLYVVRYTRCPAVLVEGGFLNNPLDARLLANGEYLDRLAKAITEGVLTFQKNRPRPAAAPAKIAVH
jgi:N-acetylmuramoyl-L-alanine amidase